MNAVEVKNVDWLENLLAKDQTTDLSFCIEYFSPLCTASSMGYDKIVQILLEHGAKVDFPNELGWTPLMRAAMTGQSKTCLLLIKCGADVNKYNHLYLSTKKTALCYAVRDWHYETINVLLQNGGTIFNPACPSIEQSPIFDAIDERHLVLLERLLIQLVNQYHDRLHIIPMHDIFNKAVSDGNEHCCIIVLQEYYPVQREESSIFHVAAKRGFAQLIRLMVLLNPQFLQEEWLVRKEYPRNLRQDLGSWLAEKRKQLPALVDLCKYVILAQLGNFWTFKMKELPLPKALKSHLSTIGLLKTAYS